MGICAYSGEKIDPKDLLTSNDNWDIDHIYPQSKVKDDSFNNKVLVKKVINEKEKGNGLVPYKYQNKMRALWGIWLKKGFITKEKYSRLIKKLFVITSAHSH